MAAHADGGLRVVLGGQLSTPPLTAASRFLGALGQPCDGLGGRLGGSPTQSLGKNR